MLKTDLDDLTDHGKKGDWCFINNDDYICLMWGDDPFKNLSILPINPMDGKASWEWDGNHESPTLSPSILVHPNPGWSEGWHGFLKNGKLIET